MYFALSGLHCTKIEKCLTSIFCEKFNDQQHQLCLLISSTDFLNMSQWNNTVNKNKMEEMSMEVANLCIHTIINHKMKLQVFS